MVLKIDQNGDQNWKYWKTQSIRVTVLGTTIFHTDNIENHLKGIFT